MFDLLFFFLPIFSFYFTVLISNFTFVNDLFLLYLKIAICWHIITLGSGILGSVIVNKSEISMKLFSQLILQLLFISQGKGSS